MTVCHAALKQLHIRLTHLTGHDSPACADDDMATWMERERAAYVLGMAVGQLVAPALFHVGTPLATPDTLASIAEAGSDAANKLQQLTVNDPDAAHVPRWTVQKQQLIDGKMHQFVRAVETGE